MTTKITQAAVLEALETEYARWEAILDEVGPARMTTPGVEGEWTVKDVIAHATYYARVVRDRMHASQAGQPFVRPAYESPPGLDTDPRNAWIYAQTKDLPLDEVLRESRAAYPPILTVVQTLSDNDLHNPQLYPWLKGSSLWEWIEGNAYEHYREHAANIRAWLDAQG